MTDHTPQRRWFHLTPDRCLLLLLALEGILLLSERFHWFAFNEKKGWTVLIAVASMGAAGILMSLWFAASLLFRWRFQFSIRSMLVLVVVVAIPCSWLAVELKKAGEQRRVVEGIEKAGGVGGHISYDFQEDAVTNEGPPASAWLHELLGIDFFGNVRDIDFSAVPITDTGFKQLRLRGLSQLETLFLGYTLVTDAGLENLKGMNQLRWLGVDDTKITDAGLDQLTGLTNLEHLNLTNTQVTDAGVAKFQKALPNCKIER